jgi:ELWxxDGT repeat protein
MGARLYFAADDGIHGLELWTSDGTTQGTVLVADLVAGRRSASPIGITPLPVGVFFSAYSPLRGREPWFLPLPASIPIAVPMIVPVLELRYFPLAADGVHLDPVETTYNFTLAEVRARVDGISAQLVNALGQGSTYLQDPTQTASLHYSILESQERRIKVPKSAVYARYPNYFAILKGAGICDYVDNKGVKEVWIWMYHTDRTVIDESTMAMGTNSRSFWNHAGYGNVSNSYQRKDLPVCKHTYTVYDYNYSRGLGEAMENHGHQIDVVYLFADNHALYWDRFVKPFGQTDGTVNHCGWVHMPPNTQTDYDWSNTRVVPSNCSDWHPDGSGAVEDVSCLNWGCGNDSGASFKLWLLQRMPGNGNSLALGGLPLRNWWELIGAFDQALARGKSLLEP